MSWKSPTGHTTPTDWIYPERAYDENVVVCAYCMVPPTSWSSFHELLIAPTILCDEIRFYTISAYNITEVDIDVYCSGNWCGVYDGEFATEEWNEKIIPNGPFVVSKARIRFYNNHTVAVRQAYFGEFDFNQLILRPLVNGSLAGNGLIGKGLVR